MPSGRLCPQVGSAVGRVLAAVQGVPDRHVRVWPARSGRPLALGGSTRVRASRRARTGCPSSASRAPRHRVAAAPSSDQHRAEQAQHGPAGVRGARTSSTTAPTPASASSAPTTVRAMPRVAMRPPAPARATRASAGSGRHERARRCAAPRPAAAGPAGAGSRRPTPAAARATPGRRRRSTAIDDQPRTPAGGRCSTASAYRAGFRVSAAAIAARTAAALLRVSCSSAAGSESATMPPPACT